MNGKDKPPELLEAGDHIENLKRSMGVRSGVCDYHDDQVRATIWIIRHMDIIEKHVHSPVGVLVSLLRVSPVAGLAAAIIFAAWVAARIHRVM